ncbi:MAG: GNAT family N-acetyltransferase [Oscillospiraceae bacterium]|nr:GNAT family N-acetyltransferase [Oscillospiraceae bacterium]
MEPERIQSYDRAMALSRRSLGRGLLRNGFPTPEDCRRAAEAGALRCLEREDGFLLFLRRPQGFDRLYFAVAPGAEPFAFDAPLPVLAELPRRAGEADAAGAYLARCGFTRQFERVRVARPGSLPLPAAPELAVRQAENGELETVCGFLEGFYDRFTGCLPTPEELAEEYCCLIPGPEGPRGVLHARVERSFGEMRHFALVPALRGTGAAEALLAAFLRGLGEKPCRLWVADDNARALGFYQKCGFHTEALRSAVWRKETTK